VEVQQVVKDLYPGAKRIEHTALVPRHGGETGVGLADVGVAPHDRLDAVARRDFTLLYHQIEVARLAIEQQRLELDRHKMTLDAAKAVDDSDIKREGLKVKETAE